MFVRMRRVSVQWIIVLFHMILWNVTIHTYIRQQLTNEVRHPNAWHKKFFIELLRFFWIKSLQNQYLHTAQ